jgi:hypothetical protein
MMQHEPSKSISPDEVNRLWQHGLHEERLFHDRLNYFSILEMGLLTIYGVMYNKEPSLGFFLPLTAVALLFTLLWLVIQARHWSYCEHIAHRQKRLIPEYRATIDEFTEHSWSRSFSVSKTLALLVPALFACTWIAFFIWLLVRPAQVEPHSEVISLERLLLGVLTAILVWVVIRLRRVERRLDQVDRR